jgi:hypothetical protein
MDPRSFINSDTLGVCVKDNHRTVLFQNTLCLDKCGNKVGSVCEGRCLQKYDEFCLDKKASVEGFRHFPKLSLENGVADVVMVNDGSQLLTLLYPLENKHREKMEYYRQKNLTKSELNIVSLLLEGLSNAQIVQRLFISKATLKTHINNIYKKIPREMGPRS